ncbi:hypothetical protein GCK72_016257 [Caenorhabditis remanei]|uniref:Uncharacterized protein n=1 Tax=Caenorhabditis remanei TaxID=31234 RepID=A0A6A5GWE0_CAERE|nr:hypothetical protein GCK72_016257 [Caenorhabditis remanei]KAF1759790.1 hypothetical protein GCK72_016257 [Caenorhabditis remanei]
MPTFKLEEMDEDVPYGGDNDMYFRQWRIPSMKPVLDEKLDRDFLEAVTKKDELMRKRAERRQQHSQKFDKKFEDLVKAMSEASVDKKQKENVPFVRKATEMELKQRRDELEMEFASPSSTAKMVPFVARSRPRVNPVFGEKMVGMKNLVLTPPPPSATTPKEPNFSAHETVFYPQTHDSFNLDHYNGSRPSFAFSGIQGATSTPVSKGKVFSGAAIQEEDGDDSVFEHSKYVTAMESPIQKASVPISSQKSQKPAEKPLFSTQIAPEASKSQSSSLFAQKPAESDQNAAPDASKPVGTSILGQKPRFSFPVAPEASKPAPDLLKPITTSLSAPKPAENAQNSSGTSTFGQKPAPDLSKPVGTPLFAQKPAESAQNLAPDASKPVATSIFGQKPAGNTQNPSGTSIFGQKPLFSAPKASESAEAASKPTGSQTTSIFAQKPGLEASKPVGASVFAPKTAPDLSKPVGTSIFGQKPLFSAPKAPESAEEASQPTGSQTASIFAQKPVTSALSSTPNTSEFWKPKVAQIPAVIPSIFGQKTTPESKKPPVTSILDPKPPRSGMFTSSTDQKPSVNLFGSNSGWGFPTKPALKSTSAETPPDSPKGSPKGSKNLPFAKEIATKPAENDAIFGQNEPFVPSIPAEKPAEKEAPEAPNRSITPPLRVPSRPFILFKNYIGLLKTLNEEKKTFETSSDPQFRSLVKRTITEKVTIFTERQTSSDGRAEILEFFKTMLQKKEVQGFAVIGKAPKFKLAKDEEVNYAVQCIVDKYISLAELDEELAPTISDLISRLSAVIRRVEKVFIVQMFNKSTLLRQNPEECLQKFVEHSTAENSDEKAIEWTQERALVTLFFTVFAKNAFISTKGRKMVLSDELLWKYVETTMAHVLEVPKASFVLLQLITTCKPRLHADEDRFTEMLMTIETEVLPELDENPFDGDEAVISQLGQMVRHLSAGK